MIEVYDYVIIGSGAGGSTAFFELTTKTNCKILLLEEGELSASDVKESSIGFVNRNLYRDAGIRPAIGSPSLTIGEGKAIGGSTEINGGLFWRTPKFILEQWKAMGMNWSEVSRMETLFEEYEKLMGVQFEKSVSGFDSSSMLLEIGAKSLGWKCVEVPRVTNGRCIRMNKCPSGCPSGAKNSMSKTLIPIALKMGGELKSGLKAIKIQSHQNFIEILTSNSIGITKIFRAKRLILSCGAIETPRLLIRSGLIKRKESEVSFHANLKVFAQFPKKIFPNRSTIFNRQIQEFIDQGLLIMGSNSLPEYFAMASTPFDEDTYQYIMDKYEYFSLYTMQTSVNSKISFPVWPMRDMLLRVKWNQKDIDIIKDGLKKTAKLAFSAGAISIVLPSKSAKPMAYSERIYKIIDDLDFKNLHISSVHLMSSIPLSANSKSLINDFAQLKIEPRIQLLDASILPTYTVESPQATVMAVVANILRQEILQ